MEAFEGTKDVFKSIGEKAKKYGKIAVKEVKKAAGLHVGPVTEANPIYYIVVAYQGAMVRQGIELDSPAVHGLRRGDLVTCVDISGRRARIIDPVEGWVSIKTHDNEPILEVTIAPDKSAQVSLMEKRFEKLKSEQKLNQSTVDSDRVLATPGQSDAAPEVQVKDSDVATVNTIKSKLSFKNSNGSATPPTVIHAGGIPKIGALKKPPSVTQSTIPPDLFSFDSPKSDARPSNESVPVFSQGPPPHSVIRVDPFADLLAESTTMSAVQPTFPIPTQTSSQKPSIPLNQEKPKSDFEDWFN
jgi:hypothetical protein